MRKNLTQFIISAAFTIIIGNSPNAFGMRWEHRPTFHLDEEDLEFSSEDLSSTSNGGTSMEHFKDTAHRENWFEMPAARAWLASPQGNKWLYSSRGNRWLTTERGRNWLLTPDGQNHMRGRDAFFQLDPVLYEEIALFLTSEDRSRLAVANEQANVLINNESMLKRIAEYESLKAFHESSSDDVWHKACFKMHSHFHSSSKVRYACLGQFTRNLEEDRRLAILNVFAFSTRRGFPTPDEPFRRNLIQILAQALENDESPQVRRRAKYVYEKFVPRDPEEVRKESLKIFSSLESEWYPWKDAQIQLISFFSSNAEVRQAHLDLFLESSDEKRRLQLLETFTSDRTISTYDRSPEKEAFRVRLVEILANAANNDPSTKIRKAAQEAYETYFPRDPALVRSESLEIFTSPMSTWDAWHEAHCNLIGHFRENMEVREAYLELFLNSPDERRRIASLDQLSFGSTDPISEDFRRRIVQIVGAAAVNRKLSPSLREVAQKVYLAYKKKY